MVSENILVRSHKSSRNKEERWSYMVSVLWEFFVSLQKCMKSKNNLLKLTIIIIISVVSVSCIYHYSTKIWNTYNNENYKQKAMDATPLNTSIIILCSAAGCTFGSENYAIFSNVEMLSLRGRKWVVGGETEIECSRIINRKFPYVLRSSIKSSLDTIVILW